MRIHHLNCISTCPLGGALMDGRSKGLRGKLACHCLLLEAGGELVLVDTGLGLNDVAHPRPRLSAFFLALVRPELRAELTAARQVERLGFQRRDVRHIVLTHLDFDHAGGLDDFPGARVHLLQREQDAAVAQATWLDRQRFRPQQWSTRSQWVTYLAGEGEPWMGFDAVRHLQGVPEDVLMVPLLGHTDGHVGVAIRQEGGVDWLLAGDAYFHRRELDARPRCTPGLRFYQWMMEKDRRARLWNQRRLRALASEGAAQVRIFCSHDPVEFERLAGRGLGDLPTAPPRLQDAPIPVERGTRLV